MRALELGRLEGKRRLGDTDIGPGGYVSKHFPNRKKEDEGERKVGDEGEEEGGGWYGKQM